MKIHILAICGLFVIMSGVTACSRAKTSAKKSTPTTASSSNSDPLKKIHGQWKVDGSNMGIGFTENGVMYRWQKDGAFTSTEVGTYRIDSTQNPMRLEIDSNGQKIVTLIEISGSREMQLLLSTDPNSASSTSMPAKTERFTKVSDLATVPEGTTSKAVLNSQAIQSEAKTAIGAMNRASQAYVLEHNKLPDSFSPLNIGIASDNQNYQYITRPIGNQGVQTLGLSKIVDVKSYTGGVFVIPVGNEKSTIAILCEAVNPGTVNLPAPTLNNNEPSCPESTVVVK